MHITPSGPPRGKPSLEQAIGEAIADAALVLGCNLAGYKVGNCSPAIRDAVTEHIARLAVHWQNASQRGMRFGDLAFVEGNRALKGRLPQLRDDAIELMIEWTLDLL